MHQLPHSNGALTTLNIRKVISEVVIVNMMNRANIYKQGYLNVSIQ